MHCKQSKLGKEYAGTISQTRTGRVCQRWDGQAPHQHHFTSSDFPEASLSDTANYCRNPGNEERGPWCYTTDPDIIWQYCDISICQGNIFNYVLLD